MLPICGISMTNHNRILYLRIVFNIALVIAAAYIGSLSSPWQIVPIVILIVLATILVWWNYLQNQIQPKSKSLKKVLEDEILPRLHKKCCEESGGNAEKIRANVMLKRWRGINPFRNEFSVWPWQRTLQIEASYIPDTAPEYEIEAEIEWTNQGVVGDAMKPRAQESWTRADYPEVDPRQMWGLTDKQHLATEHVNSVLSVPIYLPNNKVNPVGVVNLDSTEPTSESDLDEEELREEAIYWSNVIGAIVD
jgi:hypothetical protein